MRILATIPMLLAASSFAFATDLGFSRPGNDLPTVNGLLPKTSARLTVSFDCYLVTGVPCPELRKAFYAADPFIEDAPAAKAEVAVEIRAWELPSDVEQYEIKFKGTGDLPVFKLAG